jgi:hypothetical protein
MTCGLLNATLQHIEPQPRRDTQMYPASSNFIIPLLIAEDERRRESERALPGLARRRTNRAGLVGRAARRLFRGRASASAS